MQKTPRRVRRLLRTVDRERVILGVDRKDRRAYLVVDPRKNRRSILPARTMARAQDAGYVVGIVHEAINGDRLTRYYLTHRGVRALIEG